MEDVLSGLHLETWIGATFFKRTFLNSRFVRTPHRMFYKWRAPSRNALLVLTQSGGSIGGRSKRERGRQIRGTERKDVVAHSGCIQFGGGTGGGTGAGGALIKEECTREGVYACVCLYMRVATASAQKWW